jgi:hypothetical protein
MALVTNSRAAGESLYRAWKELLIRASSSVLEADQALPVKLNRSRQVTKAEANWRTRGMATSVQAGEGAFIPLLE